MALTAIVAGNRAVISDVNQLVNLFTGVTGSGTTITLINNAESLIFQPSSDPTAGTRVWTVKNAAGTVLASMRFDGLLKLLSAAAAPASPVTGSTYWDSVLTALQVYDGAAWQPIGVGTWTTFTPTLDQNGAVACSVQFGHYKIIGKTVHAQIRLTASAVGTITQAVQITGIPAAIAPLTTTNYLTPGSGVSLFGANFYTISPVWNGTTALKLLTNGLANFLGITPNQAIAIGDQFSVNLTYELA